MRSGPLPVERVRERRVEPLGGDRDLPAGEPQRRVPQERARHQAGLGEDLEAVADPEHQPAVAGERRHGAHDRAEPRDDAGPQVVAVREAARQDDRGDALERRLLVPQARPARRRPGARAWTRVAVAVAAREDDDADPDRSCCAPRRRRRRRVDDVAPSDSMAYASISGFASSSRGQSLDDGRAPPPSSAASTRQLHAPADADARDARRSRGDRGCPRPPAPADRGCRAWA